MIAVLLKPGRISTRVHRSIRLFGVICLSVLTMTLAACVGGTATGNSFATPTGVTSSTPDSVRDQQIEPYNGPKARVAVMDFEDKSGMYAVDKSIGYGLKEQLVTALSQSGAFIVLERERMQDVLMEQDMATTGRFRNETVAEMGEMEGAEFLIYGAVTEYQPDEIDAGVSAATANPTGALISTLFDAAFKRDHVAIDIRLVDARTGRVVNATSVEGKANDLGGDLGGRFSGTLRRASVGANYRTPMQKAVRACMIRAVNWIADNAFAEGVHRPNEPIVEPSPAPSSATETASPPAEEEPPEGPASVEASSTPIMKLKTRVESALLRFNPSETSTVLKTLPAGTQVNVLGGEDGWVNVNLPGTDLVGWMLQSDFN